MIAGLELCLATPQDEMEQHPYVVDALGFADVVETEERPQGVNHGGPIISRT